MSESQSTSQRNQTRSRGLSPYRPRIVLLTHPGNHTPVTTEYSIHQQDIHKQLFVWERVRAETLRGKAGTFHHSGGEWHLGKDKKRMEALLPGKMPRKSGNTAKSKKEKNTEYISINQHRKQAQLSENKLFRLLKFLKNIIIMEYTHTQCKIIKRRQWTNNNSHTNTHHVLPTAHVFFIVTYILYHV